MERRRLRTATTTFHVSQRPSGQRRVVATAVLSSLVDGAEHHQVPLHQLGIWSENYQSRDAENGAGMGRTFLARFMSYVCYQPRNIYPRSAQKNRKRFDCYTGLKHILFLLH